MVVSTGQEEDITFSAAGASRHSERGPTSRKARVCSRRAVLGKSGADVCLNHCIWVAIRGA